MRLDAFLVEHHWRRSNNRHLIIVSRSPAAVIGTRIQAIKEPPSARTRAPQVTLRIVTLTRHELLLLTPPASGRRSITTDRRLTIGRRPRTGNPT
jgi:hypothetical protein